MSTIITSAQAVSAVPVPLLTAEEFARRYVDQRAELVKGAVKELPMPFPKHGKVCATITYLLTDFASKHDCAHVMSNDSFVRTGSNPDSVRGADVSYYRYERLPKGEVPEGLLSVVPDLVIEVRSPSDGWSEIFTKVGEYLGAGVRGVIVFDAVSQTASVYRPDELQQIFHNEDVLVVPELLPGFAVAVRRFFE